MLISSKLTPYFPIYQKEQPGRRSLLLGGRKKEKKDLGAPSSPSTRSSWVAQSSTHPTLVLRSHTQILPTLEALLAKRQTPNIFLSWMTGNHEGSWAIVISQFSLQSLDEPHDPSTSKWFFKPFVGEAQYPQNNYEYHNTSYHLLTRNQGGVLGDRDDGYHKHCLEQKN